MCSRITRRLHDLSRVFMWLQFVHLKGKKKRNLGISQWMWSPETKLLRIKLESTMMSVLRVLFVRIRCSICSHSHSHSHSPFFRISFAFAFSGCEKKRIMKGEVDFKTLIRSSKFLLVVGAFRRSSLVSFHVVWLSLLVRRSVNRLWSWSIFSMLASDPSTDALGPAFSTLFRFVFIGDNLPFPSLAVSIRYGYNMVFVGTHR